MLKFSQFNENFANLVNLNPLSALIRPQIKVKFHKHPPSAPKYSGSEEESNESHWL